jgi:hypothetical protein
VFNRFALLRVLVVVLLNALPCVHAQSQSPPPLLFAVDVTLDNIHLETAFSMIRETAYRMPPDRTVGLFLFDETIRQYVLPDLVDANHLKLLDAATSNPLHNIPAYSNLAVGLERVLDSVSDRSGTEVVLFARGVIDTPTSDPRARFFEWLDVILLPDANDKNVDVTLVTPAVGANIQILSLFNNPNRHQHVIMRPGQDAPSELITVLGIPDVPYGETTVQRTSPGSSNTPDASETQLVEDSTPTDKAHVEPAISSWIPVTRLVLLSLFLMLAVALCVWFFWSKRRRDSTDATSNLSHSTSSSYLPLTEKPSAQVELWSSSATGSKHSQMRGEAHSDVPDDQLPATGNAQQETIVNTLARQNPDADKNLKTRVKRKTTGLPEETLEEFPWEQ